jgi:hypothetical protein
MQYQVLASSKIRELNEIVNYALSKGWICQGGVSVGVIEYRSVYAQAMIKED